MQHTAVAARVTRNHVTATVFVTVWPWPLTFWPVGQCMPSDCYRVLYVLCVPSLELTFSF